MTSDARPSFQRVDLQYSPSRIGDGECFSVGRNFKIVKYEAVQNRFERPVVQSNPK